MDIHSAAFYLQQGYRIKRPEWGDSYMSCDNMGGGSLSIDELLAKDWELVLEDIISYFPIKYRLTIGK
jgi:hypothetical protein